MILRQLFIILCCAFTLYSTHGYADLDEHADDYSVSKAQSTENTNGKNDNDAKHQSRAIDECKKDKGVEARIYIPSFSEGKKDNNKPKAKESESYKKARDAVYFNKFDEFKLQYPNLTDQERGSLLVQSATNKTRKLFEYLISMGVDPNSRSESGYTALHALTNNKGSIDLVKYLVKAGADINARNTKNRNCDSPLRNAVNNNRMDLVKYFLSLGVKVNIRNCKYDPSALYRAAEYRRHDIVQMLLNYGSDPNFLVSDTGQLTALDALLSYHDKPVEGEEKKALLKSVQLMLKKGSKFHKAAILGATRRGYTNILEILLDDNREDVNINNLLWIAHASEFSDMVDLLKQKGAVYIPKYSKNTYITDSEAINFALELRLRWHGADNVERQKIRELHNFIKRSIKNKPRNTRIRFLDSQIHCKYAEWRGKELNTYVYGRKPIHHVIRKNKIIKTDTTISGHVTNCNTSLKKALELDAKSTPSSRLTRFMLLSAGHYEYADPELRVQALYRSMDGRRDIYEESCLQGEFRGFHDDANYYHRSYRKDYEPYDAMFGAYTGHGQYKRALKHIDNMIKMFPERKRSFEGRKRQYIIRSRLMPYLIAKEENQSVIDINNQPFPGEMLKELVQVGAINSEMVERIREKGINVHIDDIERTLLNYLVSRVGSSHENENIPYIIQLINSGADINIADRNGYMPVHNAAIQKNKYLLSLLLDLHGNINIQDAKGKTPLLHAVTDAGARDKQDNNYEVISMLLGRGADPNKADNMGNVAIMSFHHPSMERFLKLLLKHGADINQKDVNGNSVFMRWVSDTRYGTKSTMEAINHLAKHGADINTANRNGMTPLMMAAQNNKHEVVKLLLDSGADIYMTNNKGHTAIEHVKMVKKSEQEHYVRKFKRMGTKMDDQFMTKLSRFLPKRDSVISLLEDYELTNDEF